MGGPVRFPRGSNSNIGTQSLTGFVADSPFRLTTRFDCRSFKPSTEHESRLVAVLRNGGKRFRITIEIQLPKLTSRARVRFGSYKTDQILSGLPQGFMIGAMINSRSMRLSEFDMTAFSVSIETALWPRTVKMIAEQFRVVHSALCRNVGVSP